MSEFVANKINPDNINEGKKFNKGDGISPNDLNKMVEGIVYASTNGESGLTTEEKEKVDKLVIDGNGDKFLADNGEYKEVGGSNTVDLSEYQKKTDNSLETESKDIVGAINEVNGKVGQGGSSLDVQINGASIVEEVNGEKIANIPLATNDGGLGVVKVSAPFGTSVGVNGDIRVISATDTHINGRKTYRFIDAAKIDQTVKAGITTNTLILTDTEKENACKWLGATKLYRHHFEIYTAIDSEFEGALLAEMYLLSTSNVRINNTFELLCLLENPNETTIIEQKSGLGEMFRIYGCFGSKSAGLLILLCTNGVDYEYNEEVFNSTAEYSLPTIGENYSIEEV